MIFRDLGPQETELIGMWLDTGGSVIGDAVCDRVRWLVAERLQLVKDPGGLDVLYRDPGNGRLWERRHPFEDGPPALFAMEASAAEQKYGVS